MNRKLQKILQALKGKLVYQIMGLLLVVGLVPILLLSYYNYKETRTEMEALIEHNLMVELEQQERFVDRYLEDTKRVASSFVRSSEFQRGFLISLSGVTSGQNQIEAMRGLSRTLGFEEMDLYDESGALIYRSAGYGSADYYSENKEKLVERALITGTAVSSKLYIYGDNREIHFAAPVYRDSQLIGAAVFIKDARDALVAVSMSRRGGVSGYAYWVGESGYGQKELLEEGYVEESFLEDFNRLFKDREPFVGSIGNGKSLLMAKRYHEPLEAFLCIQLGEEEAYAAIGHVGENALWMVLGVTLVILLIAVIFSQTISKPVVRLSRIASGISEGRFLYDPIRTPDNEIGVLYGSIEVMAKNLAFLIKQLGNSSEVVAKTVSDVSATVQGQAATAQEVGSASMEISSSARQIAATAKDLTGTMQEVSDVAQDTALLAESGFDGLQTMERMMEALSSANTNVSGEFRAIQSKADSISGIITTMTKVADQTNLLSLNATIEARKAKKYGQGFRVVADEIGRLANQTAKSTLEIEHMIDSMLSAVKNGVKSMGHLTQTVDTTVKDITLVSNQLANVIQQVQGLPPRFEMVLRGMESQVGDADSIKLAIAELSHSAQITVETMQKTSEKLDFLVRTANKLNYDVSRFNRERN